jgi:hypothetical protein
MKIKIGLIEGSHKYISFEGETDAEQLQVSNLFDKGRKAGFNVNLWTDGNELRQGISIAFPEKK